ncbi:cupin domain-containing protein [Caenimonas terrae]|uniref:Cupin domain-containing protein n=1 Tax=Caenimonas terrae TaxID=696074 RepID=A0ABW0NCU3_9BURK
MTENFAQFEARLKAQGFDEVLERKWEPGQVVATHTHPFDASAVVVQGEMWLTVGEATQHIPAGGTFALARATPHAERYGSEGATYWVGRRG